jgi:hypothetical protein
MGSTEADAIAPPTRRTGWLQDRSHRPRWTHGIPAAAGSKAAECHYQDLEVKTATVKTPAAIHPTP